MRNNNKLFFAGKVVVLSSSDCGGSVPWQSCSWQVNDCTLILGLSICTNYGTT